MSYVVTGATGRLGRQVVEHLLARGTDPAEVVATGRSTEKLADLAERGVRTARLDFDDVPADAFAAGDVVLLVSGSEVGRRVEQHRNVIDAAASAGVARLLYTSAPAATDTTLVLAPEHAATEQALGESGLSTTVLRNGWYTENYRGAYDQAAATGVLLTSTGEGRVASAPIADFADAAAVAMLDDAWAGRVLELSGDRAWTFGELATAFSTAAGREVTHRAVGSEEHQRALLDAGLDDGTAGFVVALDANTADGLLGVTTGDLAAVLGRPTVPMETTVAGWGS